MGHAKRTTGFLERRSPESVWLLLLAALPLAIPALSGGGAEAVVSIASLALIGGGVRLLSVALHIENGTSRHSGANWPRKIAASALIGLAVALLGWTKVGSLPLGLALGFVGTGLTALSYGVDRVDFSRMGRKPAPQNDEDDARLMETVRRVLNAIVLRIETLEDQELARHANSFRNHFAHLVAHDIALDEVLLEEIRNAITQAAMTTDAFYLDYQQSEDPDLRKEYIATLSDLLKELEAALSEAPTTGTLDQEESDALFDQMGRRSVA